ncbi:DeoR/GlpR family DNA-binding transcription regulator [Actinomyces respiraculi]|uniref:DeoR/GlpR family DNA-binding transcription regulator n=1 Tax=Actinomyces respiraculi TaxID=2744574 RepID=UPI001422D73D|nr:DeoR/GlpR family DNA-binding transcription regulator [Actinomyces respiraculi]
MLTDTETVCDARVDPAGPREDDSMPITDDLETTDEARTKSERRRARLVRIIGEDPGRKVSVNDLADLLGVSVATIRRDLTVLERDEVVSRTYGGAALAPRRREMTMAQREVSNAEAKRLIAQEAVALLNDGDLVILDAGSTAEQIAVALDNRLELTVVTNGLRCINRLVDQDLVQVLVLGGRLRGFNETICGGDAEQTLSHIFASIAFVGADAVDPVRGIASRTYDQCRLKTMMLRQAGRVYVVADSSKLDDSSALPYWAPLPQEWGLITDAAADPDALATLEARGATIVLAGRALTKETEEEPPCPPR